MRNRKLVALAAAFALLLGFAPRSALALEENGSPFHEFQNNLYATTVKGECACTKYFMMVDLWYDAINKSEKMAAAVAMGDCIVFNGGDTVWIEQAPDRYAVKNPVRFRFNGIDLFSYPAAFTDWREEP